MQKLIFIIRHAKSSWQNNLRDFDRPLNDRGLRDAPIMAKIFKGLLVGETGIVSSPAQRALITSGIFHEISGISEKIIYDENLYYGDEEDYLNAINDAPENWNSIAVFGHNPKIEFFSRNIKDSYMEDIPTCAIMQFSTHLPTWDKIEWKDIKYISHFFPKEI